MIFGSAAAVWLKGFVCLFSYVSNIFLFLQ